MRKQQLINERSLVMHRLIALRVREDPDLFDKARAVLVHWRGIVSANAQSYLEEWQLLMDQGIDACLAVATEDSEHANALRQLSPFECVLPKQERLEFLKNWRGTK